METNAAATTTEDTAMTTNTTGRTLIIGTTRIYIDRGAFRFIRDNGYATGIDYRCNYRNASHLAGQLRAINSDCCSLDARQIAAAIFAS